MKYTPSFMNQRLRWQVVYTAMPGTGFRATPPLVLFDGLKGLTGAI
jgi:hypothetical protein